MYFEVKKNILYQKGLLFISVNWASVLPMIAKIKGVKSKSLNNIACFYSAPARAVLTAGHWTGITEQKQEKALIQWTSKLACLVITRHERPSTNRFERQLPQSFWGRERGESKKEKGWRTDCRCGHSGVTNGSLSISAIQHCCAMNLFWQGILFCQRPTHFQGTVDVFRMSHRKCKEIKQQLIWWLNLAAV